MTVGGTIPADDVPELKKLGVAEVFTPGAPTDEIVEFIRARRRAERCARPDARAGPDLACLPGGRLTGQSTAVFDCGKMRARLTLIPRGAPSPKEAPT